MEARYLNAVRGTLLASLGGSTGTGYWSDLEFSEPSEDSEPTHTATATTVAVVDHARRHLDMVVETARNLVIYETKLSQPQTVLLLRLMRALPQERFSTWMKSQLHPSSRTTSFVTDLSSDVVAVDADVATPFSELDAKRADRTSFEASLEGIRRSGLPTSEALADRLCGLQEMFAEETGGEVLSVESLRHFVSFFLAIDQAIRPSLMLSPDGDIYARWDFRAPRKLSARFFPSGNVNFIYTKPNSIHDDRLDRLSGHTTADALYQSLRDMGAADLLVQ